MPIVFFFGEDLEPIPMLLGGPLLLGGDTPAAAVAAMLPSPPPPLDAHPKASAAVDELDAADVDRCVRCGSRFPCFVFLSADGTLRPGAENGVVRGANGEIACPTGARYCAGCAPDVRVCRACGCTDEAGCGYGCQWVPVAPGEADVCSGCVPIEQVMERLVWRCLWDRGAGR